MSAPQIVFKIERYVRLDPLWFDQQWFDELRADGLSKEETLREMVRVAMSEDPTSVLWEAFDTPPGLAESFVDSITAIDVGVFRGAEPEASTARGRGRGVS